MALLFFQQIIRASNDPLVFILFLDLKLGFVAAIKGLRETLAVSRIVSRLTQVAKLLIGYSVA